MWLNRFRLPSHFSDISKNVNYLTLLESHILVGIARAFWRPGTENWAKDNSRTTDFAMATNRDYPGLALMSFEVIGAGSKGEPGCGQVLERRETRGAKVFHRE